MNVQEKLLQVQSKLSAPKSQYNSFGKYHYRNCEDIQEAVKPLLKEVNAILVVGDELVQIADRFYIKATAKFTDCASQEEIINTAYAREEQEKKGMDVSQVTGSTSSYARKYALNGLFCIDDVKDADNQENGDAGKVNGKAGQGKKDAGKASTSDPKANESRTGDPDINPERAAAEKIDQAKLNVIDSELKRTGVEAPVILGLFNLKKMEDMTTEQFMKVMKKFKATPTKEA